MEGLRFVFTSFVNNFAGFSVVAVTFVAMAGVGVAEHAGLMAALIRKLVKVVPRNVIAFILIFVGVLSSVASDAGYLILIPLGAAAFLTLGRHPLAGMAAAFVGVGAIFGVNLLITPIDSMLTEITNEAIPSGTRTSHRHCQLLLLGGVDASSSLSSPCSSPSASWRRDSVRTTLPTARPTPPPRSWTAKHWQPRRGPAFCVLRAARLSGGDRRCSRSRQALLCVIR